MRSQNQLLKTLIDCDYLLSYQFFETTFFFEYIIDGNYPILYYGK